MLNKLVTKGSKENKYTTQIGRKNKIMTQTIYKKLKSRQ